MVWVWPLHLYLWQLALLLRVTKQNREQWWHGDSPAPCLQHWCWTWDCSCITPHAGLVHPGMGSASGVSSGSHAPQGVLSPGDGAGTGGCLASRWSLWSVIEQPGKGWDAVKKSIGAKYSPVGCVWMCARGTRMPGFALCLLLPRDLGWVPWSHGVPSPSVPSSPACCCAACGSGSVSGILHHSPCSRPIPPALLPVSPWLSQ